MSTGKARFESRGQRKARSKIVKGNVVLLHGWDEDGTTMQPVSDALAALPSAADWDFQPPITYETHLISFPTAAAQIEPMVANLSNLVLIGYSEGGLVARQLVANGLRVTALVTTCSPHNGIGWWIPPVDAGVASLEYNSPELNALNGNGADIETVAPNHFFGNYFDDLLSGHPDHGVVQLQSALGYIHGIPDSQSNFLDYNSWIAGWDPHLKGQYPNYLRPLIATCDAIFKA
jgi:pimeloyl-ACP methyl ester carboxylesterase